jgi:hypothetical protein
MLLIVLRIVVWPALVVASVSGIIGTGQPWFGPYNVSQSVTTAPWVSVAVLWALTPLVAQVLPESFAHHSGYQFRQPPEGSL